LEQEYQKKEWELVSTEADLVGRNRDLQAELAASKEKSQAELAASKEKCRGLESEAIVQSIQDQSYRDTISELEEKLRAQDTRTRRSSGHRSTQTRRSSGHRSTRTSGPTKQKS